MSASIAPFVHLLNASRATNNNNMALSTTNTVLMKSPAFYKTDLEARTDFVCNKLKFLKNVKEAVLMEEHDEDAAQFLEIFANNGYVAILMRLLKDRTTDAKTRSKLLLVIGNLLASVNKKLSQATVVAVNKDMETVFSAVNSSNKKHQNGGSFVLMNFAKHKEDGEIEVTLRNLNDTQYYSEASGSALTDILWAHIYSKNEGLLSYANLVNVIENNRNTNAVLCPALEILAGRIHDDVPVEFQQRLLNALIALLPNPAVKDKLRYWVYFNLANLIVEDGVNKMDFLRPSIVSIMRRDIERHFEMGVDFRPFAIEAFWCVGNAIAKMDPNPFYLDNLYLFHELTSILRHVDMALENYSIGTRRDTLIKVVDESFETLRRHRQRMSPTAVYHWLRQQYKETVSDDAVEAIYSELHRLLNKDPSCLDNFVADLGWLLEMSKREETDTELVTEKLRLIAYSVLDCVEDELEIEAATLFYEMLRHLSIIAPTFLTNQVEDAFEILDRVMERGHDGETETGQEEEQEEQDNVNNEANEEENDEDEDEEEDEENDMPDFNKIRFHWFNASDPSGAIVREVPYVDLCEFIAESECETGPNTVTIYWRLMSDAPYSQAVVSRSDLFAFTIDKGFDRIPLVVEQSSEDMEIDDSASTDSMPPLVSCCDQPMAAETVEAKEAEVPNVAAFEEGFYVSSAIDLMLGFGRYNASRTVFEIINRISANNCAPTPIPPETSLTVRDLQMLERLGFIVSRGMVAVNPYIAVATGMNTQ